MRVASGTLQKAFAVVRPPGHHAGPEVAQGFCFFNNVALAAEHVRALFPDRIRKVLILDWEDNLPEEARSTSIPGPTPDPLPGPADD